MKIKILKTGCRFGGREYGIGAVVELKDADGNIVNKIPPLWKDKAEIFVEQKRQSKTTEKEK